MKLAGRLDLVSAVIAAFARYANWLGRLIFSPACPPSDRNPCGDAIALYGLAQVSVIRQSVRGPVTNRGIAQIIESMRGKVANQFAGIFPGPKQAYYEFYTDLLMRSHHREPAKDTTCSSPGQRARHAAVCWSFSLKHARIEQA